MLVSRTRAACGADAIVRSAGGYRLGVGPQEVDSGRLAALVADATAALDGDPTRAQALAHEALALASGLQSNGDDGALLAEIRQAAADHAAKARTVLARASGRLGAHADALPGLEAAHAAHPDDESLLADLLRSEAVGEGPAPRSSAMSATAAACASSSAPAPASACGARSASCWRSTVPSAPASATTRHRCSAATATSRRCAG